MTESAREDHVLLARMLYEQEQLKESYRKGGTPVQQEPELEKIYMDKKITQFNEQPASFAEEMSKMAEHNQKLSRLYRSFVNERELHDVAIWLIQLKYPDIDLKKEYLTGEKTAQTWKQGKYNPNLSNFYFEVKAAEEELLHYIIAEDKARLLGHVEEAPEGKQRRGQLRQAIGQWKSEMSNHGKKKGKVELFLHDPIGSDRNMERIATLAGIGLQYMKAPHADAEMITSRT